MLHFVFTYTFIFWTQLFAQTIDNSYLGHWYYYTVGNANKADSNYTRLDTFVEMTFRKDGTYNYKGIIKTDIYTPGKGHLRFKKNFRYMDGRYAITGNNLQLLSGFRADENNLNTIFEFETALNKFKQPNPYFKLWDTWSCCEYALVENFKNTDDFFSHTRKRQTLYVISFPTLKLDSTKFWTTSLGCPNESDWPKPALINANTPLKKSRLDSVNNLVEDLEKIYVYNNKDYLTRYYYTSKKDKSFYYIFEYSDSINKSNVWIKTLTDSKDQSRYVFTRNETGCLLEIEHFGAANQLLETFYWR